MIRLPGILVLLVLLASGFSPSPLGARWYKGNTHAHTVNSDGDSSPEVVVRWYREHGYNFVCITDHNRLTPVEGLNAVYAAPGKFLVIPGEEVTDSWEDASGRYLPVHVNALGLDGSQPVRTAGGETMAATLQADVRAVNGAGALAQVNHPNFGWALSVDDMARLDGCRLFEIRNTSTYCNDFGGGGRPGTEALWDSLLTRGRLFHAVASDDAHDYHDFGEGFSSPGGAFVCVRAESLEAPAILAAIGRGDFYASTGVTLEDIKISDRAYTVEFEPARASTRYTVYFIGRGGRVLQTSTASPAVYRIRGDELYVRARVEDSNGNRAWTQPFFTGAK